MIVTTIDFEGSSLHGYPIEVGLAAWEPGSTVIRTWSTLILPEEEWMDDFPLWDAAAYDLHRIGQADLLKHGRPVREVVRRLGDILGGSIAYCDGGEIDAAFSARLHGAANVAPHWRLGSMADMVRSTCGEVIQARAVLARIFRADADIQHRAGPDAVRLIRELAAETVGAIEVLPLEA